MAPYAFHPEYSTANPRGNTWSAHTYNVAMSDEIGHFENCLQARRGTSTAPSPGAQDPGGLDEDDDNSFCVPGTDSTLVKINGCFSADGDWDGQSYQHGLAGNEPERALDRRCIRRRCCSPARLTNGRTNYSTIAFETDLPRIEASDSQDNPPFCDRTTGANCVNPPNGAQFYPFFSTRNAQRHLHLAGGRPVHPGHRPTTSAAARRPSSARCCRPSTRRPGFTTVTLFNNFNSGDMTNPCPVG